MCLHLSFLYNKVDISPEYFAELAGSQQIRIQAFMKNRPPTRVFFREWMTKSLLCIPFMFIKVLYFLVPRDRTPPVA